MFICLEGVDGCGKSTQLDLLQRALEERGHRVERVRDPGTAPVAEEIRSLLLKPRPDGQLRPMTELLLYNAARAELLETIVRPAEKEGKTVLSDRFCWSTDAYQGFGRVCSPETIEKLTEIACCGDLPDFTVVLDLPPEVSRERMGLRRAETGEEPDRLEREQEAFFQRVRAGYRDAAEKHPDRVAIVDGSAGCEEVAGRVREALRGKVPGF